MKYKDRRIVNDCIDVVMFFISTNILVLEHNPYMLQDIPSLIGSFSQCF